MKKTVLSVSLVLIVALSIMLVGCAGVKMISNDLGFAVEDIAEIRVSKDNVSKTASRVNGPTSVKKINGVYDIIANIELNEFDGDTFDSDWSELPSYSIEFKVAGQEGSLEMIVVKKAPNTTVNSTSEELVLIGFRSLNGFDNNGSLKGFYTVSDSAAFLDSMAKIDVEIMSA